MRCFGVSRRSGSLFPVQLGDEAVSLQILPAGVDPSDAVLESRSKDVRDLHYADAALFF
jgi:hypothetical protein